MRVRPKTDRWQEGSVIVIELSPKTDGQTHRQGDDDRDVEVIELGLKTDRQTDRQQACP